MIFYKVGSCIAFLLVGGFILVYGNKIETLGNETYRKKVEMTATVDLIDLREHIEDVMMQAIIAISELAALLGENSDMTQEEFARFVRIAMDASPYVIGVVAAPDAVLETLRPLEADQSDRDHREIELLQPNAMDELSNGEGVMTGPKLLRSGKRALVMRKPVLLSPGADGGARESWGIVSMGIDFDQLMADVYLPDLREAYDLLIFDIGDTDQPGVAIFGQMATLAHDPIQLDFDSHLGKWEIASVPVGGWPTQRPGYLRRWMTRLAAVALILLGLHFVIRLVEKQRIAERRLTNGIEALEHGFVMFGPDGDIVLTNSKFRQIHGLDQYPGQTGAPTRGELDPIARLPPPTAPGWRGLRAEGKYESEEEIADGRVIKTSDTLMKDGSIVGLRIDVTDLKKAQMNAESANQAKTDFMGVLSHELRTPMTVILGQVRLAQNVDKLPAARALKEAILALPDGDKTILPHATEMLSVMTRMMQKAESSGNHLMMLINEVLDFAKIDSGNLSVDTQRTCISDIISVTEQQMRPLVEGKGLNFDVHLEDAEVMADDKRIQQVVINLISNAVKFTDEGTIDLRVTALPDSIAITVTDSGIGIPSEKIELVFEPFHQVDSTATRRHGGTGLGLAISRDIAAAHGGGLSATSELGKGSAFTLTLPRLTQTPVIPIKVLAAE